MEEKIAKEYIREEMGEKGVRWLHSRYAEYIFAFISFAESVIAPILIDPFLVALIITKREAWIRYITIATVFSVLGGLAGYLLGFLFFDFIGERVIDFYNLTGYFEIIRSDLNKSAFEFVLLGALTPIPYKLVAIAGGLVQINIITFLAASLIGRLIRMSAVGAATYWLGPMALPFIKKHLLALISFVAVLLIIYILLRISFSDFSQAFSFF